MLDLYRFNLFCGPGSAFILPILGQADLIGFSGGGTLATLLTARRQDVERLVTVAGNLDTKAWAKHHAVSPLTGSLNPLDVAGSIAGVPQLHLVGGKDKVVPASLTRKFVQRTGSRVARIETFPDNDHGCCWPDLWPGVLQQLD